MDRSRFFQNPYSDYNSDDCSSFLDGHKLNGELISKIERTDHRLSEKLKAVTSRLSKDRDYHVYTGFCGISLLSLLKYKKTNNTDYLHKAKELVDKALSRCNNDGISFLLGDAGPLALGAVIYSLMGDPRTSTKLVDRLTRLAENDKTSPYELLYGRVGFLYALMFVEKQIGPIIPDAILKHQINVIIKDGEKKAKKENFAAPLMYEWYNTNYLGAAHGVSGILYILLSLNRLLTADQKDRLIKPTLDWLATERFPSGNFKSSEGRDRDALVHWCHGAPGVIYLYTLASKIYNCTEYMKIAEELGEVVWERGLLKKGYSICHGVSGNGYTFLHLYQITNDLKHLYRAACFADWCTTHPENEGKKPDSPYSLFEGIAGIDYFLTDVLEPEKSAFPAFVIEN